MKKTIVKKIIKFLIITALVIFLFFCGLYIYLFYFTFKVDFTPINFDSKIWKASPSEMTWESPRLKMVDSFVESYNLIGKKENIATNLLGKPNKTQYFSEYELVYHLGKERSGMAIDSEWLVININSSGMIDKVEILRD